MLALILRRAQGHRRGDWPPEDYDVLDGDRDVGRIYQVNAYPGKESWFWGLGSSTAWNPAPLPWPRSRPRMSYGSAKNH